MSLMIKELPSTEKPRERFKTFGASALSNEELIAIVLRTGVKDVSVKELACNVIKEIGNINMLPNISLSKLAKIKGVGEAKAITLFASIELGKRVYEENDLSGVIINNTEKVYKYYHSRLYHLNQENFIVLFLDIKKKLIKDKTLFIGTIDQSIVHPREIFKEAYLAGASFIICLHNHPSGVPSPSNSDILLTQNIKNISEMMLIPLLDHIIIGKNSYYSFLEHGEI